MNKFILLDFLLTVLVANTNSTVTPFSCYYTAQGDGPYQPGGTPANSAQNCVTACYRLTTGVKLGSGLALNAASNSINSVIHSYIATGVTANTAGQSQGASSFNSPFTSTNAFNALPSKIGLTNMGHIGILPFVSTTAEPGANAQYSPTFAAANTLMKDFVRGDKGCLPILNLATVPATGVYNGGTAGSTEPIVNSNINNKWRITPTELLTNTDQRIIGTATSNSDGLKAGILSGGTTQAPQHVAQTISKPLQLAYNVFSAAVGGVANAATVTCSALGPVGTNGYCIASTAVNAPLLDLATANNYAPNQLANSQINQVALDMAAIVALFCVSNGVCCIPTSPTVACNADPADPVTKSGATQINLNTIVLTIFSMIIAKLSLF